MFATALFAVLISLPGTYVQGDGLGFNWTLTLDADHSYFFVWTGCLGEYGRAEGEWLEDHGVVRLQPHCGQRAERFPSELSIITWGERTYLIPSDDMPVFCAYVHTHWEPRDDRHGMFFMRDGDEELPADGAPDLPAQYRAFLLPRPVRAHVTSVRGTDATIDAGAEAGLVPGMRLTIQPPHFASVRIVHVSARESLVELENPHDALTGGELVSTLIVDDSAAK